MNFVKDRLQTRACLFSPLIPPPPPPHALVNCAENLCPNLQKKLANCTTTAVTIQGFCCCWKQWVQIARQLKGHLPVFKNVF